MFSSFWSNQKNKSGRTWRMDLGSCINNGMSKRKKISLRSVVLWSHVYFRVDTRLLPDTLALGVIRGINQTFPALTLFGYVIEFYLPASEVRPGMWQVLASEVGGVAVALFFFPPWTTLIRKHWSRQRFPHPESLWTMMRVPPADLHWNSSQSKKRTVVLKSDTLGL